MSRSGTRVTTARSGARRWISLAGGLALAVLAVVLGVVGAAAGFFGAAIFSARLPLLCAAALALCFGASAGLTRIAARLVPVRRRSSVALGVGVGTAALVTLIAARTLFLPLVPPAEVNAVDVPPDAQYWNLPTGSRIAYRELRARTTSAGPPIIYLHGGPGAGVVTTPAVAGALSFLTALGFDLYLYDQIGGGRSSRLPDARQYSIARHVRDLEAVRKHLGSERVILIGESWGAVLASYYIASHPQRVQSCVLVSPGPLPGPDWGGDEPCDLRQRAKPEKRAAFDRLLARARPRVLAALVLLELDPSAASAFLPDSEADAFARRLFSLLLDGAVCDPATLPAHADFDFGLWSNLKTEEDIDRQRTPIDERLRAYAAPVLILSGDCDYCRPEIARHYATVFPRATPVSVEGAGHLVWLDRPAAFAEAVRAFLTGTSPTTDQE